MLAYGVSFYLLLIWTEIIIICMYYLTFVYIIVLMHGCLIWNFLYPFVSIIFNPATSTILHILSFQLFYIIIQQFILSFLLVHIIILPLLILFLFDKFILFFTIILIINVFIIIIIIRLSICSLMFINFR